ncbi:hypothetical protein [Hoeflea sp.]|uniref:hypothetical protein n=1 Tax=Hoeflea sp. TaxID=1940281 RepID=UPI003A8E5B1F
MIAFIRNSGLAAVGQGELAGKLKELNPELLKQLQMAKTQEERFRLVADAVQAATSETEKAAIASAAFGRNGAKMVELLKGGADGFDKMAIEARRLGLVIDRELLASAEKMNDELTTAKKIMDAEFKKALIDLAPFLISTARLAGDVASAIRSISDAMKGLQSKSKVGLLDTLAEKEANLKKAETSTMAGFILKGADGEGLDRLKGEIATIKAELKNRAIDELRNGLTRQADELQRVTPIDPDTGSGGRGASRNKAAEATLREAAAVKDLIADLQTERAEIGMSDLARQKSQALREAGAAATDEQKSQIVNLIDAIDREADAQAKLNEATEFFGELASDAFTDMIPAIETGNAALDRLVNTLIEAVAQAALLGKGPLAGIFGGGGGSGGGLGGIFAGIGKLFGLKDGGPVKGYASGGAVFGPGGPRSDKVPAMLSDGEFVVNANATKKNRHWLEAINNGLPGFANGGAVGKAPRLPRVAAQPTANSGGGHITVTGEFGVLNGNLVPIVTAISGQVAGKQIKQANRTLAGRMSAISTRGTGG